MSVLRSYSTWTSAALITAAALTSAHAAVGDAPPPIGVETASRYVAVNILPAEGHRQLKVSSPVFKNQGDLPFKYTGYRENLFPGLVWSKGPRGTRSYVAVLQDADALHDGDAILHWTMYNIPSDVTRLPTGMTTPPQGAALGPNRNGTSQGYLGPKTGPGRKHRYPFQVFALDTVIPYDSTLSWTALKQAMDHHILASGETVALGQLDPTATVTPPPGDGAKAPAR